MNYRKKAGSFSAETQGQRLKRLLQSRAKDTPYWSLQAIGNVLQMNKSTIQRKMTSRYSWSKEEIQQLSDATGIPFDELYVPTNNARLEWYKAKQPVTLSQVIADTALLDHFVGTTLDSTAHDQVAKYLHRLERFIAKNKDSIRRRRAKEIVRNKKVQLETAIFHALHEESGIYPSELRRIFHAHGNYGQFQTRYEELRKQFTSKKEKDHDLANNDTAV